MSLPANLFATTQLDAERLIADEAQEGPNLDFKRDFPKVWNSDAKHELLADVTAFANAGGGDLIFGMDETGDAKAPAIVPQSLGNADQEVRRIQDFLLNLVEPRLPATQVHAIPVTVGGETGHVVAVRVPQSWEGPHRVKTNQHFFIREGARKRQLDVPEFRGLFLRSESRAQRVRDFRTERLGRILAGDAPHRLVDGPMVVAHLIPTQAALGLVQVDPVPYMGHRRLPLLGTTGKLSRVNIDGALSVRNSNPEGKHGYSQLFRNGFFESVQVFTRGEDHAFLHAFTYEEAVIALLSAFRAELKQLGIGQDTSAMLSILRAQEMRLATNVAADFLEDHQSFFDRQTVVLPDVLTRTDDAPEIALKPVFDLVWQAAGFERSLNFDAAGNWVRRK